MKKVTTMAIIGGKEKQISVYIEEDLADWLDTIDQATRRDFIVEEWKTERKNRAETRRHNSLERLLDAGWDVAGEEIDFVGDMDKEKIVSSLQIVEQNLEPQQKKLLWEIYVERKTLEEIGALENVSKVAIHNRLEKILKKFRKILKKGG
mgnify:FL=1